MKTVILITAMAALTLAAPPLPASLGKAYVPPGVKPPGPTFSPQGWANVVAASPAGPGSLPEGFENPPSKLPEKSSVPLGFANVVKVAPAVAQQLGEEPVAPEIDPVQNPQEPENPPENLPSHENSPAFGEYEAPIQNPEGPVFEPQPPATVVSMAPAPGVGADFGKPVANATVANVVTLAHHFEPHDPNADNTGYSHGYVLSNGQHHEASATLVKVPAEPTPENGHQNYKYELSVRGSYSHVAPDGQVKSITYVADKDGFKPEGKHLPGSTVV